ncbi:MAG: UTP--glucose-1-phosphate uridylyltransferase [Nitrospirae bacterium GWC2_57_13]|nr:MAG: UTP--glucose-1-phosphate uridylyltransferase [Nitrospirae bacterium GWC2_57_13]OGW41894.1 MAG: UTP--glucose-1-phosphate uridylyltransferase [Nitrospirae bacterium GWD2_57_8]HAS54883.1 UTP--glucose-1-phosphate uridylyltransferase [Nitrospiraceae bacterium]
MITKAVFPAAGFGTRFLPATKASPKEMLNLVDKPLIQYVVEEAVASGIEEVVLVTGRGKRAIEDHFDVAFELEEDLKAKGKHALLTEVQRIAEMVTFCYVRQKKALGLGHAVLTARRVVGDDPFAVLLGDDIIDSEVPALKQMMEVYQKYPFSILAIQEVSRSEVSQYGVIDGRKVDDRVYEVRGVVEKPAPEDAPSNLAIIGRYILTPEIFTALENTKPGKGGEIQLTDGIRLLMEKQPVYAYLFKGDRHDAGDKLGFLKATVQFGLRNEEFGAAFKEYLQSLKI